MGTKKFVARPVHWAIDPGNKESGWVQFWLDPQHLSGISLLNFGKTENRQLRKMLHNFRSKKKEIPQGVLSIEMVCAQGMREKNEIFETCVEIGRFLQTWGGPDWCYVLRRDVKMEVGGSNKANDTLIRANLIDLWGGEDTAIGGKKCPKCKGQGWTGRDHDKCPACKGLMWAHKPGPLYGVSKDTWAALAVAVYWATNQGRKHDLTQSRKKVNMACDRCKLKNCQFRGDEYNIGCEPGIDCLAAK